MVTPQSTSCHPQTMEEAENNSQESDEASPLSEEQRPVRKGIWRGKRQTGMVQTSEPAHCQLSVNTCGACLAK